MEKYFYYFRYNDIDDCWNAWICKDRYADEKYTGTLLRKFINNNFPGETFKDKVAFWRLDESEHFVNFAKRYHIELNYFKLKNPCKSNYSVLDYENMIIKFQKYARMKWQTPKASLFDVCLGLGE